MKPVLAIVILSALLVGSVALLIQREVHYRTEIKVMKAEAELETAAMHIEHTAKLEAAQAEGRVWLLLADQAEAELDSVLKAKPTIKYYREHALHLLDAAPLERIDSAAFSPVSD